MGVAGHVVLWIVIGFVMLLALGVLGEVRRLRAAGVPIARLPVDSRAPAFAAIDVRTDRTIGSGELKRLAYTMLFVSPHCGTCRTVLQGVSESDARSLVVICRGEADACRRFAAQIHIDCPVLVDAEGELASRYGASATPTAIAIENNRIRGYSRPRREGDLAINSQPSAAQVSRQPSTTALR